jgi:hypothetical protein
MDTTPARTRRVPPHLDARAGAGPHDPDPSTLTHDPQEVAIEVHGTTEELQNVRDGAGDPGLGRMDPAPCALDDLDWGWWWEGLTLGLSNKYFHTSNLTSKIYFKFALCAAQTSILKYLLLQLR